MVSHPELGSDPPIGSDRESGCDKCRDSHCARPSRITCLPSLMCVLGSRFVPPDTCFPTLPCSISLRRVMGPRQRPHAARDSCYLVEGLTVMEFVGVECIVGFVGVEFVVVHVVVGVGILTMSTYSSKTRSLQLHLLQSSFG